MGSAMSAVSSRRGFLKGSAGLASAAAVPHAARAADAAPAMEPFHGPHQAGVATRQQAYSYFAVFNIVAAQRQDIQALCRRWTGAAARLTAGMPVDGLDSGEEAGLPPARLTLTFGFGAGLFVKDGQDRFGLQARRPEALIDLPAFPGDQLQPGRTGGDLSVQACAEDPQTAFHAVRQLCRLAHGTAELQWAQSGFLPALIGQTPRNLLGFKDGTQNLGVADPFAMSAYVWAGAEGPAWMRDGTYLVARRIHLALERWDATQVAVQEQTIGRRKASGAPLGAAREFDAEQFHASDAHGHPVVAENAHVRLASYDERHTRILRRGYSFNDGLNVPAGHAAPAGQGATYDAGLLFMAYQKDPRTGFVKMFETLSRRDRLNEFATHVGSGVFAIPPGIQQGGTIGETLLA
jgi:deferrochelatase/peroxidase EfeB